MSGVGGITSAPLINFNVIIDEDLSLLSYIIRDVRNEDVFDLDKVDKMTYIDMVKEIYHRKYNNPLYFLMKDEKDKEFLDQCYKEFMDKPDFLSEFSIATDAYTMLENFVKSGEIYTTIIYKNDYEKEVIDNDPVMKKADSIYIENIDLQRYTQIFFYRFQEAERFYNKGFKKTFYISSMGCNMNEDSTDLIDEELIVKIDKSGNNISVFDMYRSDIIGQSIF